MAGSGYKLFSTGDVLSANDANTYFMQQTVMVFNSAAARTTALTGVVSEGMITYLKDTNAVEVYDGSNWVASDDPNAIQNTIVDAKGDLIAASAADTPARLAVGNNGETLVADSSTATGLRWQSNYADFLAGKNLIINGGFDIWQRGTTGAGYVSSGGYVADRWQGVRGAAAAGMTMSRQAAQNTALPSVQYGMRIQRDSGNTSTQDVRVFYSAETADSIPFAGKTITFSYYVRKGANYSGGDVIATVYSGTGTDQNLAIAGFTGSTAVVTVTRTVATLTTDWTRVQGTATVASTATELGVLLYYTPTGTAGANDWIEITGVQLENASTASSFRRCNSNYQGELAACQRYYYASDREILYWANVTNANNYYLTAYFPVPMRIAPNMTTTDVSNTNFTAGAPSTTVIGKFSFWAFKGANGTGVGNFQFNYTASAEL